MSEHAHCWHPTGIHTFDGHAVEEHVCCCHCGEFGVRGPHGPFLRSPSGPACDNFAPEDIRDNLGWTELKPLAPEVERKVDKLMDEMMELMSDEMEDGKA